MATAPTPTETSQIVAADGSLAAAEGKRQFLRLTFRDKTLDMTHEISLQERMVVLNATGGIGIDVLMTHGEQAGQEVFSVLWWLARRQNGERSLPWAVFAQEWPTDATSEDITLDEIDLDAPVTVESLEAETNPESPGRD